MRSCFVKLVNCNLTVLNSVILLKINKERSKQKLSGNPNGLANNVIKGMHV